MSTGNILRATSSVVAILTALLVVMWTNSERYYPPGADQYVTRMFPGGADFTVIFTGTRAVLRGHDPYHHTDADNLDPWRRVDTVGGRGYHVAYQPSHFVLYMPLAIFTTNARALVPVIFFINLACYLGLALVAGWIVAQIAGARSEEGRLLLLLAALFFVLFVSNAGAQLCLERGQSDVLNAMLCWSSVALFLRGHRFWPMFLAVTALLIKGYALVLCVGLAAFSLEDRRRVHAIAGGLTAAALLLIPVAKYVPDGITATLGHATGFFQPNWLNHGFKNTFFHVSPSIAEGGRLAMTAMSIVIAGVCWKITRGELRGDDSRGRALWLTLFATSSLATMVGFSGLSYVYNQILFLPGAVVLLASQAQAFEAFRAPPRVQRMLGVMAVLIAFLLFKFRLDFNGNTVPAAGYGLVALMMFLGLGLVLRASPEPAPPAA